MCSSKFAFAVGVLGLALATAPAHAATIEYIFSGTFAGSLGTTDFRSQNFTVTLTGDTSNVTFDGSEYKNITSGAVFTVGSSSGTLLGSYNDVVLNQGFNSGTVIFGQQQPTTPFFVGEGVSGSSLGSYALDTALATVSGTAADGVSQTMGSIYQTSLGDLVFNKIATLSFQAEIVPAATPLPASLSLFMTAMGLLGMYGWQKNRSRA